MTNPQRIGRPKHLRVAHGRATRRNELSENFCDLTVNGNGRPVRGIVSAAGTDRILQSSDRFGLEMMDDSVMETLRSFGGQFDKDATGNVTRMRTNISVPQLDSFLSRFAKDHPGAVSGVDQLEKNLIKHILPMYPHGASYPDREREGYIYNRSYRPEDYKIIFAGLFIDPPGSSEQFTHSDVSMADRDALWNVTFPIDHELHEPYVIAESMSGGNHRGGDPLHLREACIWDAGWPHKGNGNPTDHRRVLLHLALAPYWMITCKLDKAGELDFGDLDDRVKEDLLEYDKLTPFVLEHLHGGEAASATESRKFPSARERVQLFWEGDGKWYSGVVKQIGRRGKGKVLYDDGETCEEDFGKSKWRPAPSKHAMPHSSIAKEYNQGKALHDPCGEIISWVGRASKATALPRGERDEKDRAGRLAAEGAADEDA